MPIRAGSSNPRCAATAASTADLGEPNAAHIPSPVCLNMNPPCAAIAERNTSSWAASATRMASESASHRRVEPSISVNRNVTTPEGGAAGGTDTPAECHTGDRAALTTGGNDASIRPGRRDDARETVDVGCRGQNRGNLPVADAYTARERAQRGGHDDAVPQSPT